MRNILANLPTSTPQEEVGLLCASSNVRIERILSTGHRSPPGFWYDQEDNEWVTVISGSGEVVFENGNAFRLNPGDHLFIPARTRHRVQWTSPDEPTVWIAVFFPRNEVIPSDDAGLSADQLRHDGDSR